mgnify:CR=1 FL=1
MNTLHTEQALLYKQRRTITQGERGLVFERYHIRFLVSWLARNKKSLALVLVLIVFQMLIEACALMFAHDSVRERVYLAFHNGTIRTLATFVCCGVAAYLCVTYFALLKERQSVIDLINELRRLWFASLISRPSRTVTYEMKADTIAKMSYHLPLLSMGLDHSLFGGVRWFLSTCILFSVGALLGIKILGLVVIISVGSLLCMGVAYWVAHYYISQEVTSYSQVIRTSILSFFELSTLQTMQGEHTALRDFDNSVGVDSYFRVRRDVWLRYVSRAGMALLFLGGFVFSIILFTFPGASTFFSSTGNPILMAVIALYGLRLFYESIQTGLYLPPLRLGVLLSIPKHSSYPRSHRTLPWSSLKFFSNKIKFYEEGNYFKHVSMTYVRGGRYLCVNESGEIISHLAQLLGSEYVFNQPGWQVQIDDVRMNISSWFETFDQGYYLRPSIQSEKTLGELILAKDARDITSSDMETLYKLFDRYPVFSKVLPRKRFVSESVRVYAGDLHALCAIQILACIIQKKEFIVVDPLWIDLLYPELNDLMHALDMLLPEATLVVCSRQDNNLLAYTKVYTITNNEVQVR